MDAVSGHTLLFLGRAGPSTNMHWMMVHLQTLDGRYCTKRLRQLRQPMPGEVRTAQRARFSRFA